MSGKSVGWAQPSMFDPPPPDGVHLFIPVVPYLPLCGNLGGALNIEAAATWRLTNDDPICSGCVAIASEGR